MDMKSKKTSFAVTKSTLDFENLLLSHMDIPRTVFHRRMIDYFFNNHIKVHEYLLIKDRIDPNYVQRKVLEKIYIDDERLEKREKAAEEYGCKIGVILFQALMS
ncbi:hypothetical protein H6B07_16950, partial [Mediterraneibacter glycyrrhizinilyticus]|nr:hypothetical protein [Mediterraneibacter glycyrrhizinilyticus]